MLTPRDLLDLAVSRHRQPWNFTAHCCGLCLMGLALLLHSGLCVAAGLILLGTGLLILPLPPMPPGRWRRSVDRLIAAEVQWINTPMNGKKLFRTLVWAVILGFTVWTLWARELLSLTLLAAMLAVYRAYLYNKTTGID
ncbi:hypothetical protein [Salidesulfovibrio onnuriiensis]|uniref:hypothetical protein n=1 Tax=Salidesulfovibrio onnuriiensis TaxID=2583823 RepID=UPI0011C785D3|nr:hypothetical protein [Salidesulfovibrio onnuriiensis]